MAIHIDLKISLADQQQPVIPNLAAKRHDTLWLPDGDIILATNTLLFRVHKSVLSLQSSVFRDMLASPMAEDLDVNIDANEVVGLASDSELHEGLPLVILPEDGEDFEHLLKKVYKPRYVIIFAILYKFCLYYFCTKATVPFRPILP